jgi:hypothetical protein
VTVDSAYNVQYLVAYGREMLIAEALEDCDDRQPDHRPYQRQLGDPFLLSQGGPVPGLIGAKRLLWLDATEQTRDATVLFDATSGGPLIRDSTVKARYHNLFERLTNAIDRGL